MRITICAWATAGLLVSGMAATAAPIVVSGTSPGLTFEGIGALSAGGSSRLLIDYPEKQKAEILDYLFRKNFGAGLQHLKIEIGGDVNSTDATEPSYQHRRGHIETNQGYELWLAAEAKHRNGQILLQALEWGAPQWIGNGSFFSSDNIDYIVGFHKVARSRWGLSFDYQGIWNEKPYDVAWIKALRKGLDAAGLSQTQIVAADDCCGAEWKIADDILKDPQLASAVARIGAHYPGDLNGAGETWSSTAAAKATGIPLWSSEDGPWRGDWTGAESLARRYNRNYVVGRMTSTLVWSPVTSYYDILSTPGSGLMRANEPWSGHYELQPAIWATAHTTQFAQPGWRYIDSASKLIPGGSVVGLAAPNGNDFSLVIETTQATQSQRLTFQIADGLRTDAPLHVWQSDARHQFVQLMDITPVNGAFSVVVPADSIVSITTTTGQLKGTVAAIPVHKPFPLPYQDDFAGYRKGALPRYFMDQAGMFETEVDLRGIHCLQQIVPREGIRWYPQPATPVTVIGDASWTDVRVTAAAILPRGGFVSVMNRVATVPEAAQLPDGYEFRVSDDGTWALRVARNDATVGVLGSGHVDLGPGSTHQLALTAAGNKITAAFDGAVLASVADDTYRAGAAGLGSSYDRAEFRRFSITPVRR